MATIIGLKELRNNVEAVSERANSGERFVVVKRSKSIFRIVPLTDLSTCERKTYCLNSWSHRTLPACA